MIKYVLDMFDKTLTFARASKGASGYDLRANLSTERVIAPGERWLVPTGLFLSMPVGIEAQVRSRSGLSINHGVIVLNAPGTIDSDYRGEIKVSLINHGGQAFTIVPGERIAQLVFCPVFPEYHEFQRGPWRNMGMEVQRVGSVGELGDTARGAGGHGSTGR